MKNESVAILDIRSGEVSFSMGARGVNGTFVFSDTQTKSYEGFCVEGFLDEHSFRRAVVSVITSVRQHYAGVIDEVYVGVPSAFVQVLTKGHTILFPSKRKITAQDVDALYESGLNDLMASGYCIRRSAMYLSLGDNRKYFSVDELFHNVLAFLYKLMDFLPVGAVSLPVDFIIINYRRFVNIT